MKSLNHIARYLAIVTALLCAPGLHAQVIPNTQIYPNSTTQILNPIPSAYATGTPVNYLRTWDAQQPFSNDTSLSSAYATIQQVHQITQYLDGLSRPIQTVAKDITPSGYDLVIPTIYDTFSRIMFKYLPYVDSTADGNFKNSPFTKQGNFETAFYNPTGNGSGEKFFYGKDAYEPSPLNRVDTSYAPGNSWTGRAVGVKTQYQINTAADSVVVFNITSTSGVTPTSTGYYAAGVLAKTLIIDERGYSTVEYKDETGHTILKKVQITSSPYSGHTGWLCTYYVYDDVNNLRYVLQPLAVSYLLTHSWTFDATTWSASAVAKGYCFSYEYDGRGRTLIKRAPGTGEVWMVYDERDRLVMSQDSALRAQGKWLYTDYDSINRPVLTGIWTNSNNQTYHENLADTSITYPTPTSGYTVLTQTYYDNYSWVSGSGSGLVSSSITTYNSNTTDFYTASNTTFPYPQALTATNLIRGLATGTKTNVINTSTYLYVVGFYDDRVRTIETQSTNYTGSKDTLITQYSFTGQVLRTLVCHGKSGTNPQAYQVLAQTFYDGGGRVTQINQKTGNSPMVTVAQNQYDELSELMKKSLGQQRTSLTNYTYTSNPVDTLRYTYNIRGWLRGINKDYANIANGASNWFGMELNYDYGFSTTYLNGNIAGIKWRNANDGQQRAYGFSYDVSNRLTKADFTQYTGSAWNTSAGVDFSVHSINYDGNGNITAMNQMGVVVNAAMLIDSLAYGYNSNSNQLNYVTDRVNDTAYHLGDFTEFSNTTNKDYAYDGNGNLTLDSNKHISLIHYNYLNLPDSIIFMNKGYIKYAYDATGLKLQKIVFDSTVSPHKTVRTDYVGLFVYQNDTLQYVGMSEGRVRPLTTDRSDTMFYDYTEKDHLGNTRVVLTDQEEQDVYPAASLENNANSFALEEEYYSIKTRDTICTCEIASWSSTTGNNYANNNGDPPYNNNPYLNTTATSTEVYKLNGATGDTTGLGVTLKVMKGDVIDIYAKSFWHNSGTLNNGYVLNGSVLPSFLAAFAGTSAVASAAKGSATTIATDINSNSGDVNTLLYLLDTSKASTGSTPRAYINWILFNDQFAPISSGSGFDLINTTADAVKNHHKTVTIPTGGYLYVYCSNESNFNVYFDNLQVIDTRGPLMETDNYYPFGLNQAGISSQAAGKLENLHKYNGKELQHKEFSNGSGLEWHDYGARMYDQQIGRWDVIDPHAGKFTMYSPYNYALNNPIMVIDPNGKDATLEITRNKKTGEIESVTVSATFYISGDAASQDMVDKLNQQAASTFANTKENGVQINFNVSYQYAPEIKTEADVKKRGAGANLITIINAGGESEANIYDRREHNIAKNTTKTTEYTSESGQVYMLYPSNGHECQVVDFITTVIHESIHLMGLTDRYGNDNKTEPGFEGDPMSGDPGALNMADAHYRDYVNYFRSLPRKSKDGVINTIIDEDPDTGKKTPPSLIDLLRNGYPIYW